MRVMTAAMRIARAACASMCIAAAGCMTSGTIAPMTQSKMEDMTVQLMWRDQQTGQVFPYRVYVPQCMKKVPVVVWLHGAGQRGADNSQQLDSGAGCLMSLIAEDGGDYDAVFIAPQCPAGVFWRDEKMLQSLMNLVNHAVEHVPAADPSRICIAGFSMGGDAAWKLALSNPSQLAAILPVCGGPLASMEPDIPEVPSQIAGMKIWAFNNFDDPVVRPDYAKRVLSQLWSIDDGDNFNFTEGISGGHDASNVMNQRKLLIWFLSAKRRD